MNPGATTCPVASIERAATTSTSSPGSASRSPVTATRPGRPGAPVPSTSVPPAMQQIGRERHATAMPGGPSRRRPRTQAARTISLCGRKASRDMTSVGIVGVDARAAARPAAGRRRSGPPPCRARGSRSRPAARAPGRPRTCPAAASRGVPAASCRRPARRARPRARAARSGCRRPRACWRRSRARGRRTRRSRGPRGCRPPGSAPAASRPRRGTGWRPGSARSPSPSRRRGRSRAATGGSRGRGSSAARGRRHGRRRRGSRWRRGRPRRPRGSRCDPRRQVRLPVGPGLLGQLGRLGGACRARTRGRTAA